MHTETVSNYRGRLKEFHKKIIEDRYPLRISGQVGDVVVMAADDYENLVENLYVLKDKVTMASLLESRKEKAKKKFRGTTINEAFSDLMESQNKQTGKRRS